MADRWECKYCGLPVARVVTSVKFWGRGEPPEDWFHTRSSVNSVPKCERHFLKADEVVLREPQVPVQD